MPDISLIQKTFPPILGTDELSLLLKRKNINNDRCNRPHTLPEACIPPDTQKPLWILEDVIEWLRQHKETPKHLRPITPKKGAPTKAERIAKRESVAKLNNSQFV